MISAAPHPETRVGGEAIPAAGVVLFSGAHQADGGLLEGIGRSLLMGGQGGAMTAPGMGNQAQVVPHQLITGPDRPPPNRQGRLFGALGMALPDLDAPRQFQHRALSQGMVPVAALQPVPHRGCDGVGMGSGSGAGLGDGAGAGGGKGFGHGFWRGPWGLSGLISLILAIATRIGNSEMVFLSGLADAEQTAVRGVICAAVRVSLSGGCLAGTLGGG